MRFAARLWAVMFRDHIHMDEEGKLAVFATRKDAARWKRLHGGAEFRVIRVSLVEGDLGFAR